MKLFAALCRRKYMPNGHIYRGKDRIVKDPTKEELARLKLDFEIEEQNMFLLRHPYLTLAESTGHGKALNKEEKRLQAFRDRPKPFYENVKIEDRLNHLRWKEVWD